MHLLGLDHYARTLSHVHSGGSITFSAMPSGSGAAVVRFAMVMAEVSVAAHRFRHQYEKSFSGRHTPVTFTG
jgi:hypothetical protein